MKCKKCGSENVTSQIVTTQTLKDQKKGLLWWLSFGWLWVPIKWIMFTLPALILKLFGRKKQKLVSKQNTVALCQNCGHSWTV